MTKFSNFDLATAQSLVSHASVDSTRNLLLYNAMFAYAEMKGAEETYNAKVEELKHCNWRDYGRLLTERNEAKKVFDTKKEIVDAVINGLELGENYFEGDVVMSKDGNRADVMNEAGKMPYEMSVRYIEFALRGDNRVTTWSSAYHYRCNLNTINGLLEKSDCRVKNIFNVKSTCELHEAIRYLELHSKEYRDRNTANHHGLSGAFNVYLDFMNADC